MNEQARFDLVFDIGETMLKNGGEIKRIERTLRHVSDAFGLEDYDSFVLINGIFLTARVSGHIVQAKVKDIPISPINLGRIEEINRLSRHITEQKVTPEEARVRLDEIKQEHFASDSLKIFAYGFGSASFCYIFGGTIWDSLGAFFIGGLLAVYTLFFLPKMRLSQIMKNITSSMLIGILAWVFVHVFPILKLPSLVTGGVIPLVPGVAIVNGIRSLFDEDYSSGWGQMINAVITALCISIGVGLVLRGMNW